MAIMFYWIIAVIWTRSPALLWFRSSHLFGWWRRKQAPTARVMPLLCQFNTIKLLIRIHQRMNNTSSLPILMENVHKLPTLFYSIMQTMHTRLDWISFFYNLQPFPVVVVPSRLYFLERAPIGFPRQQMPSATVVEAWPKSDAKEHNCAGLVAAWWALDDRHSDCACIRWGQSEQKHHTTPPTNQPTSRMPLHHHRSCSMF